MSVLPDVGSELPTDSDVAVVCTACIDEVRDDTLDVVGLGVWRMLCRFCRMSVV